MCFPSCPLILCRALSECTTLFRNRKRKLGEDYNTLKHIYPLEKEDATGSDQMATLGLQLHGSAKFK